MILIVAGSAIIFTSFTSIVDNSPGSQHSDSSISITSPHWSGYVVMSNLILRDKEVTTVTGSWTVPSVEPTESDVYLSIWVGIGGFGETSLIQTGTTLQNVNGSLSYYAWYELLPNNAVKIQNFTVSPGDIITASVRLINPNNNTWNIEIRNLTGGSGYSRNFIYSSSRLSAEWIVEAPLLSGELTTLANFGSVEFTDCFATITETTGVISDFPGYQLVMYDSQDNQLVDVSSLNTEGSGFTVTYSKNGN